MPSWLLTPLQAVSRERGAGGRSDSPVSGRRRPRPANRPHKLPQENDLGPPRQRCQSGGKTTCRFRRDVACSAICADTEITEEFFGVAPWHETCSCRPASEAARGSRRASPQVLFANLRFSCLQSCIAPRRHWFWRRISPGLCGPTVMACSLRIRAARRLRNNARSRPSHAPHERRVRDKPHTPGRA